MVNPLRRRVDDGVLTGLRRYAANSSWMLLEHMLRLLAGLFVGAAVARHLGPAQFGVLIYALAFVALFAPVARLGLDTLTVRLLLDRPERGAVILGTAFCVKLAGAAVALALVAIGASIAAPSAIEAAYVVVIAAGLLFQSLDVIEFWFQARVEAQVTSACRIAQLIISSAIKIVLVLQGAGLAAFVAVALLDQALLAAALSAAYRRLRHPPFAALFDLRLAGNLLREARPLIVSGVLVAAYMRIDQLVLNHLVGPDGVGIYAAAINLTEAMYFLPTLVTISVFPALVAARARDETAYRVGRMMLYRALLGFAIGACVIVSLSAKPIVGLLYGQRFGASAIVLSIHVWAFVFVTCTVIFGQVIIADGRQHLMPRFTLIGLMANVAALFLLVPTWGVTGAAAAAVIAQAAIVVSLPILDTRTRDDILGIFGIVPRRRGEAPH